MIDIRIRGVDEGTAFYVDYDKSEIGHRHALYTGTKEFLFKDQCVLFKDQRVCIQ